jgi:hypothetical protein
VVPHGAVTGDWSHEYTHGDYGGETQMISFVRQNALICMPVRSRLFSIAA